MDSFTKFTYRHSTFKIMLSSIITANNIEDFSALSLPFPVIFDNWENKYIDSIFTKILSKDPKININQLKEVLIELYVHMSNISYYYQESKIKDDSIGTKKYDKLYSYYTKEVTLF